MERIKVPTTLTGLICQVCGEQASGFHYGVDTCSACKIFYRRNCDRPVKHRCEKGNNKVRKSRRKYPKPQVLTCPGCRMDKCQQVGMAVEAIRKGRYTFSVKYEYMKKTQHAQVVERDGLDEEGNSTDTRTSSESSSETQPLENGEDILALSIQKELLDLEDTREASPVSSSVHGSEESPAPLSISGSSTCSSEGDALTVDNLVSLGRGNPPRLIPIQEYHSATTTQPTEEVPANYVQSLQSQPEISQSVVPFNTQTQTATWLKSPQDLVHQGTPRHTALWSQPPVAQDVTTPPQSDSWCLLPVHSTPPPQVAQTSSVMYYEPRTALQDVEKLATRLSQLYISCGTFCPGFFDRIRDIEQCYVNHKLKNTELDVKPLAAAEYKAFYDRTGIDVDGRQERLTSRFISLERRLRSYVTFVKKIQGFSELPSIDQEQLFKACHTEIGCLSEYRSYNVCLGLRTLPEGIVLDYQDLLSMSHGDYVDMLFNIMERLHKLQLTEDMRNLLKCAALFSPEFCVTEIGKKKAAKQQSLMLRALELLIRHKHPQGADILSKILIILGDMRQLRSRCAREIERTSRDFPTIYTPQLVNEVCEFGDRSDSKN